MIFSSGVQPVSNTSRVQPVSNTSGVQPVSNTSGVQPVSNPSGVQPVSNTSGVQPVSNLQAFSARKRSVSYTFTTSGTSGTSFKVTYIPQKTGIPQPPTETFSSAGLHTKYGLVPDVTYRLQVVAVLSGVESTARSVNFTTLPDGELWQLYWH